MWLYSKDEYVERLDEDSIQTSDLSQRQREFLCSLNEKLMEIEKIIKKEAIRFYEIGDARLNDEEDWVEDFEVTCLTTYRLKEKDPFYDEDGDNVLYQHRTCGKVLNQLKTLIADSNNHGSYGLYPEKEFYCYLFHELVEHADLGWCNILRIGSVDIDIDIVCQKMIDL